MDCQIRQTFTAALIQCVFTSSLLYVFYALPYLRPTLRIVYKTMKTIITFKGMCNRNVTTPDYQSLQITLERDTSRSGNHN